MLTAIFKAGLNENSVLVFQAVSFVISGNFAASLRSDVSPLIKMLSFPQLARRERSQGRVSFIIQLVLLLRLTLPLKINVMFKNWILPNMIIA